MPYRVTSVSELHANAPVGDAIASHLNAMEAEGWTLVAVVPQQQLWDEDGNADGLSDGQLVLHRP